jgi:hypothetical protein
VTVERTLIEAVRDARYERGAAEARVVFSQDAWAAKNRVLLDEQQGTKLALGAAEERLRDAALADYEETGSKAPGPGLGIRVVTDVVYEVAQALTWAKEHGLALRLDNKQFETLAKADPLSVAEVAVLAEHPQATIATNLDAALQEAKEGKGDG